MKVQPEADHTSQTSEIITCLKNSFQNYSLIFCRKLSCWGWTYFHFWL